MTMTPEQKRRAKDHTVQALMALVVFAALVSFNLWYTAQAVHKADQRWCQLITGLDDRWRAIPSPAPESVKLARDLSDLRRDLGCVPPGPVQTDPRPAPSAVRSSP